ncbi:MAG: F0F1 ATP synthase subunit alpha, partial [bacterium]
MNKNTIIEELKKEISDITNDVALEYVGEVVKISDGVAIVSGLSKAKYSEMLEFTDMDDKKVFGLALNLEEDSVGAIILGNDLRLREGSKVRSTGRILSIPVSEELIGRVVNGLGEIKDGKGSIEVSKSKFYPLEKIAPGVITRESVKIPLHTGIKAIDAMIPIGRGQRELIIGDRQTGKT